MSQLDFLIPPIDVASDVSKLLDDLHQSSPCCNSGSGCSDGITPLVEEDGSLD